MSRNSSSEDDADIDAIDAEADDRWLLRWRALSAKVRSTREKDRQRKAEPPAAEKVHALNLVKPLLKVEPFDVFPGSRESGVQVAREDLRV